jgi:hypothetical protein
MRLQRIKKIRFHALGFSTHSPLENTETLRQPPLKIPPKTTASVPIPGLYGLNGVKAQQNLTIWKEKILL